MATVLQHDLEAEMLALGQAARGAARVLAVTPRALKDQVKIHGCTVHFVTADLDCGPIIAQAAVPVMPDDTEAALAKRVLAQEHRLYPMALKWLAAGLVRLEGDQVVYGFEIAREEASLSVPRAAQD